MWQHHFEFLLLGYGAYLTFFDFCKKAFPEISDQTVARMVAGIEAEIFRPDDELRRLAKCAIELGVDNQFREGVSPDEIIKSLEQLGEPGAAWLKELAVSRDPWFNINVGDGFYHYHRSWNDDLSMPFAALPGYIANAKKGQRLERQTDRLMAERKQLIADYRELLETDEERAAYDQMIELAHRVFPYVEGHKFYCEHWYTNLFFNKIREFGGLLARARFFPKGRRCFSSEPLRTRSGHRRPDDFLVERFASARPSLWPAIVRERKAAIAEWAKHETAPALGPVPDIIDDPAIVMLWGITRENLDAWLTAGEKPDSMRSGASPRRMAWWRAWPAS